ncbi:hypothetical protein [Liquorilactobacillus hordei]|uniref:hypothetical protein n=1 Tax=Liquorilactobacillus hordei TaxID=468911 RepID=UPI0039EA4939
MEFNATNVSYALSNGVTNSVSVTLHASDNEGSYFDGVIKVESNDLAEGKTSGGTTQDELIALAKSKLANITKV